MSGMRRISERKAIALNFLNPLLSTNQRPRFWALNQWEASISGPPILTHFQNKTAISAIRLQSQQSDCNLSNQTVISASRLQSQPSDCNLSNQTAISTIQLQSPQSNCNLRNPTAISAIQLQSVQSSCNAGGLQSDYEDCSLIAEIAV